MTEVNPLKKLRKLLKSCLETNNSAAGILILLDGINEQGDAQVSHISANFVLEDEAAILRLVRNDVIACIERESKKEPKEIH